VQARIVDIGPNQVCLAWPASRRSPLITEFAALAQAEYAEYPDTAGTAEYPDTADTPDT
jgi:hypothetical protein